MQTRDEKKEQQRAENKRALEQFDKKKGLSLKRLDGSTLFSDINVKSYKQLLVRACNSGINFYNTSLSGMVVENVDFASNHLDESDLSHSYFYGVNFFFTSLRGADLSNSTFVSCDFSFSDLRGVNFENSKIVGCSFRHAELTKTRFELTHMNDCELTHSSYKRSYINLAS